MRSLKKFRKVLIVSTAIVIVFALGMASTHAALIQIEVSNKGLIKDMIGCGIANKVNIDVHDNSFIKKSITINSIINVNINSEISDVSNEQTIENNDE
jgi:hypothetical protein